MPPTFTRAPLNATEPHGAIIVLGAAASHGQAIALLESCAFYAGARMSNDGVRNAYNRYERLASTDALTGLANRRRFDEMLETEWNRARPLSVRPSDGAAELLTPADRQTVSALSTEAGFASDIAQGLFSNRCVSVA